LRDDRAQCPAVEGDHRQRSAHSRWSGGRRRPGARRQAFPPDRDWRHFDHTADDRQTRAMSALKILSVASEVFPLIKTGGLADVVGALPAALARESVEVRTLLPGYPAILTKLVNAQPAHAYDDLFGGPARVLAGSAA